MDLNKSRGLARRIAMVVCAGALLLSWGCQAGTSGGGGGGGGDHEVGGGQEGPVDITGTWDVIYAVETVDVQIGRAVGDQWQGTWQITDTAKDELTLASEAGTMTSVEIVSMEGLNEWQGRAYLFWGDIPFELETSGNAAELRHIYIWSVFCWADSWATMHGTIEIGTIIGTPPHPPIPADTWTFAATRQ